MKIYISGKITGLDAKEAFGLFEDAETSIRDICGHEPVNPMRDEKPGLTWAQYLAEDIVLIEQCDAIFLLPNWQDSNGARLERLAAELMGKAVFEAIEAIPQGDVFTASNVDHPSHYNAHPSGIKCIDVVRHMSFNVGNAMKYLWRADQKGAPIEDLKKAAWYVADEIQMREKTSAARA